MTDPLTLEEILELEAKAKAATPGPYRVGHVERFHVFTPHGATMGPERVLARMNEHFENYQNDAALHASLDPATVLRLLSSARRLAEVESAPDPEGGTCVYEHAARMLLGYLDANALKFVGNPQVCRTFKETAFYLRGLLRHAPDDFPTGIDGKKESEEL